MKLTANALLATKISFANEVANLCEATGADVERVMGAVGADHRLGAHFLKAGLGWGGSCFPKDSVALKQLAANSGYPFQLLSAVIEVNDLQRRRAVNRLKEALGGLSGKTVALLGLTFKANTDDMREAPSTVIAARLLAEGATVRCWDPMARLPQHEPWTLTTRHEHTPGGGGRRGRGDDRHRVAPAARRAVGAGQGGDGRPGAVRRPEPAGPAGHGRGRIHLPVRRPGYHPTLTAPVPLRAPALVQLREGRPRKVNRWRPDRLLRLR